MATPDPKTICDAAAQECTRLRSIEAAISDEINSIRALERDHPRTDAEKSRLKELRESQSAVTKSIEKLLLITLAALGQSAEVARIVEDIKAVRLSLQTELEKVKNIGRIATEVATAVSGMATLATNVNDVAKSFEKLTKPT